MNSLLWFLLGCALSLGTMLLLARSARRRHQREAEVLRRRLERSDSQSGAETRNLVVGETANVETVAVSIGQELGNLATSVEGHAQSLCEVIGDPAHVPVRMEQLWNSVRRLRFFSEKILSFVHREPLPVRAIDIRELLTGVRQELEDHSGGSLEVNLVCADTLQQALGDAIALRNAVLFLVETLLGLEPDAGVLALRAHTRFDDAEGQPSIEIEIQAQCEDVMHPRRHAAESIQLGYVAARNLIVGQDGRLAFEHSPGLNATARIWLTIASSDEAVPIREPVVELRPPLPPHRFGGVLILENDASLRGLLSQEVERFGRNILSIGDGAAARSLFDATPERFELLVLAQGARRGPTEQLALHALEQSPEVKVLLLAQEHDLLEQLAPELRNRCHVVTKPFGLMELREALCHVLGSSLLAET